MMFSLVLALLVSDGPVEAISIFEEMQVDKGGLEISTEASWEESGDVYLDVTLSNKGEATVCVLKGDIYTAEMWDEYGIFSDFMMVRDSSGKRKPYYGPLAGGEVVQNYVEIKSGEALMSKYNLTQYYQVAESAFATRNFIFYANCDDLNESELELETMGYFFGDVQSVSQFKKYYENEYFSLGGKYADTGWVKHIKPTDSLPN